MLKDMLNIYPCNVRAVLEYAAHVWQDIPTYLSDIIESFQVRALRIIFPDSSYQQAPDKVNVTSWATRRIFLCKKLMAGMRDESYPTVGSASYNKIYIISVIINNAAPRIRETTVEPEVTSFLTPHVTVRKLLVCFVSVQGSFHFIYTLHSREIKENCSWTVQASLYSFTWFFIQKPGRYSSISRQQVTEISKQLRQIGGLNLNLCAFYHNSFFDAFQRRA